ncbi:MAG: dTMP kinase, partial [Candidatus Woesearchaeota archaeon]
MRGVFISFESGDGGGKTTQIELLVKYLAEKGFKVIKTREPGGIELAEALRNEVKHPDKQHTPEGELLLYSTARYLHMLYKIRPALEQGCIVITDRLHDSTIAYQGHAGGIDLDYVKRVQESALNGIKPGLTIYIDVDPEIGLSKSDKSEFKGRPDRLEAKGLEFHRKVREGYLKIAKEEPERI